MHVTAVPRATPGSLPQKVTDPENDEELMSVFTAGNHQVILQSLWGGAFVG